MKQNNFARYLREIVYGGNDGIVTTFAIVAGFSGASIWGTEALALSFLTVLLFGIANLFSDGVSMGLGGILSTSAQSELQEQKQVEVSAWIKSYNEEAQSDTKEILLIQGFSATDATEITKFYSSQPKLWLNWLLENKYLIANVSNANPIIAGVVTFFAFITFGIIPLLPFIFLSSSALIAFIISTFATLLALILLGILKWRVTKAHALKSIMEIVLVGSISALVAFSVGFLFQL